MKEYAAVLLSLTAITVGVLCLLCYVVLLFAAFGFASRYVGLLYIGLMLAGGGTTYVWINGRR